VKGRGGSPAVSAGPSRLSRDTQALLKAFEQTRLTIALGGGQEYLWVNGKWTMEIPVKFRGFTLPLGVGVIAALVLLTTVSMRSAQNPGPPKNGEVLSSPSAVNGQAALITPKPKGDTEQSNLEKTRTDAAELCALADQIRDELNKMNVNVLPLDVIKKTVTVEKLAKKIKEEANRR
jgi:hypothetical protein